MNKKDDVKSAEIKNMLRQAIIISSAEDDVGGSWELTTITDKIEDRTLIAVLLSEAYRELIEEGLVELMELSADKKTYLKSKKSTAELSAEILKRWPSKDLEPLDDILLIWTRITEKGIAEYKKLASGKS